MNWIENTWAAHGTKVLGFLTGLSGFTQAMDIFFIKLMTEQHHMYLAMFNTAVGYFTVRRGFSNSKRDE